jgi:hypothetical protein
MRKKRERNARFAAARLADERNQFARIELERDIVHNLSSSRGFDPEVLDRQNGLQCVRHRDS